MHKTAVAFVQTDRTVNWVISQVIKNGIDRLMLISEEELVPIENKMPFEFEIRNISEFRPIDLDKRVQAELYTCYQEWLSYDERFQSLLKLYGIESAIGFSYASIIFQLFRRIIIASDIIGFVNPDVIITDQYWSRLYTPSVPGRQLHISEITENRTHRTLRRKLRIIKYAFASFIGGILLPVCIGKVVNLFAGKIPRDCSLFLIGDSEPNRSFRPVWMTIKKKYPRSAELRTGTLSFQEIKRTFHDKVHWVDGFSKISSIPRLLFDYGKICFAFFMKNGDLPLPNQHTYVNPAIAFSSDSTTDLVFFFLRSCARALCYRRLSDLAIDFRELKGAIFTLLSPATRSLSGLFRDAGVNTVSTTHGMVLEPIAYCSDDSIKLTWSQFDANLLRAYSRDKQIIGLPINPEGYKKDNEELGKEYLRVNQASNVFPMGLSSSLHRERVGGKCVAVFPSTNQHGQSLRRFLQISLSYLISNQEMYGFDYILIKPKNHPRTNIQEFCFVLESIVPDDLKYPVVLTGDIDISSLLQKSVFAICAHSSIMLDCMRVRVPFSVYVYGTLSDQEFVSFFPTWMKFRTSEDLERICLKDLSDFAQTCSVLEELYWGKDREANNLILDL